MRISPPSASRTSWYARPIWTRDLVYEITKAIYENLEYLQQIHPSLQLMNFDSYKDSMVPLHPGAKRFYEEMGFEGHLNQYAATITFG